MILALPMILTEGNEITHFVCNDIKSNLHFCTSKNIVAQQYHSHQRISLNRKVQFHCKQKEKPIRLFFLFTWWTWRELNPRPYILQTTFYIISCILFRVVENIYLQQNSILTAQKFSYKVAFVPTNFAPLFNLMLAFDQQRNQGKHALLLNLRS